MKHYVESAGKYGIIEDTPDYRLPKEAWTSVRNIRPIDGIMVPIDSDKLLEEVQTYGEDVTYIQYLPDISEPNWFFGAQSYALVVRDNNATEISSSLLGSVASKWTGGVGTVNIFNNGVDNPFQVVVSPTPDLVALSAWPANYKCKMMRPFREFWVAGDISDSGTRYNQLIHWSAPSAPGVVPPDWDYASSTSKSGRKDLADEGGSVVDAVTVGRSFYIYKDETTWAMSFKGGVGVMQIDPFMNSVGVFAPNHWAVLPDNTVFVVGPMGVIVHDSVGSQRPVFKRRIQRWLDTTRDSVNYRNGYVTHLYRTKEIQYAFPSNGSTFCDMAIIWSYEDGHVFIRDMPDTTTGGVGQWDQSSNVPVINDLTSTINSYDDLIDSQVIDRLRRTTMYIADGPSFTGLYAQEEKGTVITYETELVKTGMLMGTQPIDDKLIRSVTPFVTADPGVTIEITIGYQDELQGRVTWEETRSFTPSTDVKADFRVEGKIPCIRFRATGEWSLYGYMIDYDIQKGRQRNA